MIYISLKLVVKDDSIDKNNDDEMDDDDEDDSNTSSCVQSLYVDEIPVNREAYHLFPDKIRGDLKSPCLCKQQCSETLFQDENIIYRVQHIRSDLQGHRQERHNDGRESEENPLPKIKGLHAVAFMDNFIDEYGDPSPERDVMLLPDCINIKYMYDEHRTIPGLCIKERRFYQLFSENFEKIVSFVKHTNPTKCQIVKIQYITDFEAYAYLFYRGERRDYYKKKDEACMKSKEVMSIIIDGMDQSKTNIPRFKDGLDQKVYSCTLSIIQVIRYEMISKSP
ncbi:unnamed protein product [Mytilus coruscus]|uniref:Uncharacterized protein n=1 Tax=Mytilus coruscus TaxID=42192 RepID=A0A6J8C5N6_MYTCO|nr:unnamed protein product [Mytilus coruscus]